MYEDYYGLKENPFEIIPNPDVLYLSSNHNQALKYLEYGIKRNIGILLLTGEIGSGKTTLIKYLLQQFDNRFDVAFITNTNLNANQLLMYVLIELNVRPNLTSKAQNLLKFKGFLKSLCAENRRALLIFDEAQNLPRDALEEIRMLSNFQADNSMPLQIFLIGQPELRKIIKSPGTAQIRQRIAVNYHLNALNRDETEKYIGYRLTKAAAVENLFHREAIDLIYKATSGIPRSINILCDSCLVYGFAEELRVIDSNAVREVIAELNLNSFVTRDISSLDASQGLIAKTQTTVVGEHGKENSVQSTQIEKSLRLIEKKIDLLDVKLDLLRQDFFSIVVDAARMERLAHRNLSVESSNIRSDHEKVESELENVQNKDETEDPTNSRNVTKGGGKEVVDAKVYRLEK